MPRPHGRDRGLESNLRAAGNPNSANKVPDAISASMSSDEPDRGSSDPSRHDVSAPHSYRPTDADIERAANIPVNECPRRYCWWWRSLSFEFDIRIAEGCTYMKKSKPRVWVLPHVPCSRCDSFSTVDQYEPRDPHLMEDGFEADHWGTTKL